jgi:hypothetical protein
MKRWELGNFGGRVVAKMRGCGSCDLADMGRSVLRPYMTVARGLVVAMYEGSCGRRKMTTTLGVSLYRGGGTC